MLTVFRSFFHSSPPPQLSNLKKVTTITYDNWNNIRNGNVNLEFFNNDKSIGYIDYRRKTGQIGLIWLEPKYRNFGLGKEMLNLAITDCRKWQNININKNINITIWAVTSKDHPFWSNVYKKSFKWSDNVHTSVSGHGYYLNFENYENLLKK